MRMPVSAKIRLRISARARVIVSNAAMPMRSASASLAATKTLRHTQLALLEAGHDEAVVAANLRASWVWGNVLVAASDAEAERIGIAAFETMTRARAEMRNRIFADTG